MEEDSLGTCSVGLQQQRRLIRADKGEIRRFTIEKVVCGHCANRLRRAVGKTNRWEGEGGKRTRQRRVKLKCKMSMHKNRLNTAC